MSRTVLVIATALALSSTARAQFLDYSLSGKPVIRAGDPKHSVLGTVIGISPFYPYGAFVAAATASGTVVLEVTRTRVKSLGETYFETVDCTGDPVTVPFDRPAPNVFPVSLVMNDNVYVQVDEPPAFRTVRAQWDGFSSRCALYGPAIYETVHMVTAFSLADFPPPYQFAEWTPQP